MTSPQPMYEITEQEQRRLEKLLRKHRKKLLAYPNVHNVDVGFEFSDGQPTGRLFQILFGQANDVAGRVGAFAQDRRKLFRDISRLTRIGTENQEHRRFQSG